MFSLFTISFVKKAPSEELKGKPIILKGGQVEFLLPDQNFSILIDDLRKFNNIYYSNDENEYYSMNVNATNNLPLPAKFMKYCFIFVGINANAIKLESSYGSNMFSLAVLPTKDKFGRLSWIPIKKFARNGSIVDIENILNQTQYPVLFVSITPSTNPKTNDSIVIEYKNEKSVIPTRTAQDYYSDYQPYNYFFYDNYPYHGAIFPTTPGNITGKTLFLANKPAWAIFMTIIACAICIALIVFESKELYPGVQ